MIKVIYFTIIIIYVVRVMINQEAKDSNIVNLNELDLNIMTRKFIT